MKIGFIGCGNMANAMISGILSKEILKKNDIGVFDINKDALQDAKKKYDINVYENDKKLAENCEVIVLSVKPQFLENVLVGLKKYLSKEHILLSIVAGKDLEFIKNLTDTNIPIARVMPNTPALVAEGMSAICYNECVSKIQKKVLKEILSSIGRVEEVEEYMMDAVTAVSGSSPAYVFLMIEAMADAAVLKGLPRDKAYVFASQAILGSAKLVLETKLHPGVLKDMVTSPLGTTIEAIRVLERFNFRSALIEAMIACSERSSKL